MFLKVIITSMVLVGLVNAATPEEPMDFPPANFKEYAESAKLAKKSKRKVAAVYTNTTPAFQEDILKPWMKDGRTPEGIASLLDKSFQNYDSYKSPDVQYFLAQLHVMIPLQGIVWRLRPLFETGFKGNRATHVTAVQLVRNITTSLSAAFPTEQTNALIKYFTMPSAKMTQNSQFQSIVEFQNFLVGDYTKALKTSIDRIKVLHKANPAAVWVWDNKMFYGTASFKDGFNQFVGHGPAERHLAMAMAWESIHDAHVFSAYNQNEAVNVAGKLGRALGMDVFKDSDSDALGLTDKERVTIIRKVASDTGYLDLKGAQGTKSEKMFKANEGADLMKKAYNAKSWSIVEFTEAYNNLSGKSADIGMAINPALYQANVQNRLNGGIKRMGEAIQGKAEFRDPISTKTVTVNVPAYYNNPPSTLVSLMATNFEGGEQDASIRGKDGKDLKYRNYLFNRANTWNNDEWSKYVSMTEDQKKDPGFMMNAKRILHYSLGAAPVFGAVDIFVR